MKNNLSLPHTKTLPSLLLALFLISIVSCSKLPCSTPSISTILLPNADTTLDSVVIIKKFAGNSGFGQMVDSSYVHVKHSNPPPVDYINYNFQSGFCYSITVLPVNKVYTVTGVSIGHDKMYSSGSGSDQCTSRWSYILNGKYVGESMNPNPQMDDQCIFLDLH